MIKVTKDPDLKEAFFTTPLALTASESPNKYQKPNAKGNMDYFTRPKGKGKGKGSYNSFNNFSKGSGKHQRNAKGKHGDFQLVSQTPDGRDICFAYNSQGCNGKCGRVHVCRVKGCFGEPGNMPSSKAAPKRPSDRVGHCNPVHGCGCCISSVAKGARPI